MCCNDDRSKQLIVNKQTLNNQLKKGLSVSAIRSRYQTTLRCFTLTEEVLSGQGVREDMSLSG